MEDVEKGWLRLKVVMAKEFGIQPSEIDRMDVYEIEELIRVLGEIERARKTEEALAYARRRV